MSNSLKFGVFVFFSRQFVYRKIISQTFFDIQGPEQLKHHYFHEHLKFLAETIIILWFLIRLVKVDCLHKFSTQVQNKVKKKVNHAIFQLFLSYNLIKGNEIHGFIFH